MSKLNQFRDWLSNRAERYKKLGMYSDHDEMTMILDVFNSYTARTKNSFKPRPKKGKK